MAWLNTTLVKIGENEYRVEDKFTLKYNDGTSKFIDYEECFNKFVSESNDECNNYWEKIVVNEFQFLGIEPITIWNRENYIDGLYENPLKYFKNKEGEYGQFSENEYVNLLHYLFEQNIINNEIVVDLEKYSNRYDIMSRDSVKSYYEEDNVILVNVYDYGFSNKLVAFVNPKYFDIEKLPRHIQTYSYDKLPLQYRDKTRPNRYAY